MDADPENLFTYVFRFSNQIVNIGGVLHELSVKISLK